MCSNPDLRIKALNLLTLNQSLHYVADVTQRVMQGEGKARLIIESIVAFLIILVTASVIYLLGRRAAPKPTQSENRGLTYACGEKTPSQKLKISVPLSRYLIYFVILDSSVLLLAFATLVTQVVNIPLFLLYLFMMLASSLLLLEGGSEQ